MPQPSPIEVAHAYRHCRRIAAGHYENFPVASLLLPARLRDPVAAVYAFARGADDIADEGDEPAAARIAALKGYAKALRKARSGDPTAGPVFIACADAIGRFHLPAGLFDDLLSAFLQDVTKRRYADFDEVLDYCRRSADPVGRLLLHLAGAAEQDNLDLSDRICTALQLINFLQDLEQDYHENDRIYLPADEMRAAGVTERHFERRLTDPAMAGLVSHQIRRTRSMMLEGRPLGRRVGGRFGLELRLIVEGGLLVLDRLEARLDDVFARPRLRRRDYVTLLRRALAG